MLRNASVTVTEARTAPAAGSPSALTGTTGERVDSVLRDARTLRHADLAVLALQLVLFESALPLLDVGLLLVLVEVQNEEAEFAFEYVLLPLGQLLLALPQELFVGLLLQGRSLQFLLATSQLLEEKRGGGGSGTMRQVPVLSG